MEKDTSPDTGNSENSTEQDRRQKTVLDLDTILVEEIGQFGLYQLRSLLLALIVIIFAAWVASEYIFSTARISTRCFIPECESIDHQLEFAPSWILNAVPGTSNTSFENCERFANVTTDVTILDYTCPATLFDRESKVSCDTHVYEHTNTVVYNFDLACDEWRRSLIGTIRTCGTLIGLPLTGFVSDRWGRRTALTLNAFNTAWVGITRYFADSYAAFVSLEILESALGSGGFSCAYILDLAVVILSLVNALMISVMELVGPKYRVAAGATMNTFFAVGQVTLGLIAWGVQNWRKLTLTLYIPQLITISYFWIMSESVRWYMSKGRYEDSEKVLKEVAQVNGKVLSEKSLQGLRQSAEEETQKKLEQKQNEANETWLITLVFQNKPILIRCIVSPIWWITNTFIYYGMSINSVNMSGNQFLNYVAVSAVEIPGYWTSFLLIGRIGRKPVLITAFWVCGACQIAYIFISEDLYAVSLTVYLVGKFSIAMVMTAIYVYTAELYPTKYRHRLFAFSSMMGRIGAILAPLTPALGDAVWDHLPSALFGGFALLSGCLVFITPETLGSKLPDTMEEASNIGRTIEKT